MINNDLDLLPEEFRPLSLSPREIVLPYEEAIRALEILRQNGVAVGTWEGWLNYSDGKHGHAPDVMGLSFEQDLDESWDDYVQRSNRGTVKTIKFDYARWQANPTIPNAELYFCITCGREPRSNPPFNSV